MIPGLGPPNVLYCRQTAPNGAQFEALSNQPTLQNLSKSDLVKSQLFSKVGPRNSEFSDLVYFARKWPSRIRQLQIAGTRCHIPIFSRERVAGIHLAKHGLRGLCDPYSSCKPPDLRNKCVWSHAGATNPTSPTSPAVRES